MIKYDCRDTYSVSKNCSKLVYCILSLTCISSLRVSEVLIPLKTASPAQEESAVVVSKLLGLNLDKRCVINACKHIFRLFKAMVAAASSNLGNQSNVGENKYKQQAYPLTLIFGTAKELENVNHRPKGPFPL